MRANLELICRLLGDFRLHHTGRPTNYGAAPVGGGKGWYMVSVAGVEWRVIDNGGELMVGQINDTEHLDRAVPLTMGGVRLNEATVAGRVAAVMRGEAIDYDARMTDEEQEEMLAGAGS